MQKCKTKREMAQAFSVRYTNIPIAFIYKTLENMQSYGDCFDAFEDYEKTAVKIFDVENKKWVNELNNIA